MCFMISLTTPLDPNLPGTHTPLSNSVKNPDDITDVIFSDLGNFVVGLRNAPLGDLLPLSLL